MGKNKKTLALMVCLLLLSFALVLETKPSAVKTSDVQDGPDKVNSDTVNNLYAVTASLSSSIRHRVLEHKIPKDDWGKLDFSYPEQKSFGNNSIYEVFNFEKGERLRDMLVTLLLEHSQRESYIYTLDYRVNSLGTNQTELIAIAPGFKESSCNAIQDISGTAISVWDRVPDFVSLEQYKGSSQDFVFLNRAGCVKTPTGYFYYQTLMER